MRVRGSMLPTTKWIVTQTTAVSALLTATVSAGGWNKTLTVGLIGLVTQAFASYMVSDAGTGPDAASDSVKTFPTPDYTTRPAVHSLTTVASAGIGTDP